jgi:hypothetical protein
MDISTLKSKSSPTLQTHKCTITAITRDPVKKDRFQGFLQPESLLRP